MKKRPEPKINAVIGVPKACVVTGVLLSRGLQPSHPEMPISVDSASTEMPFNN